MWTRMLLLLPVLAGVTWAGAEEEPPARPAEDRALKSQLEEIDAHAARIKDFTARFRQQKFTALLKKPLVSSGTVRVSGPVIRWDTREPEPAVLFSDGKDVRMYYPGQKLLEIYPIDQRLGDLAASPLPKLETLRENFTVQRAEPGTFPEQDAHRSLPLRLIPIEEALREHVDEVRVLLDPEAAHILELEVVDADGDRTRISFEDVRLDTGLQSDDLALRVPEGTTVSRPLDAAEGAPPSDEGRDK